jgi:hypothetical protein
MIANLARLIKDRLFVSIRAIRGFLDTINAGRRCKPAKD